MKQIIVVEGKNDLNRIKDIYSDAFVITTNGKEIKEETKDILRKYKDSCEIILFLDPDFPGESIRKELTKIAPNAYQAFIPKKLGISKNKRKVGIEHAKREVIEEALANLYKVNLTNKLWEYNDLFRLGLTGATDSKKRRDFVSAKLNIGAPNAKSFLERLNSFEISVARVEELLEEYESNC